MNFEVQEFKKTRQQIVVFISLHHTDKLEEVKIRIPEFEAWLDISDRLDWETNTEVNGEHVQKTGRFKPVEYWEQVAENKINEDLKDFLIIKEGAKIFDAIQDDLTSICNDYKNN